MTPATLEIGMLAPPSPATSLPLLDSIDRVADLLAPHRRVEARRLADRLKGQPFRLALLGEFKRGKSSLGNALLGAAVLPVGVLPTTAVPTLVRYGPEPSARARLRSGGTRPITLAELADFATEKGNPENVRDVAMIEVFLPAAILRSADLLDSPGTGSAHRHNTEAALAALGEIDAAVVVLAADQAIGEAEIEFLATLRRHVARFFFVVNRADLLAPGELADAVEYSRSILQRHGFGEPEIFPLSARAAGGSGGEGGFRRFRAEIERFLREDRGPARIGSIRVALESLASEELFERNLAAAAARLGSEQRAERIAVLREAVHRVRARRNDRRAVLKGRLERLLSAYDDAFGIFKKAALRSAFGEISAAHARLVSLPNAEYDRRMRQVVETTSSEHFRTFLDEVTKTFGEGLGEIVSLLREETAVLNQELYRTLGETFRLAEPPTGRAPELPDAARFDFSGDDVRCQLEATTDFLVLHAPRPIARRLLARRASARAGEFHERGGGRLRFELLTRGESFLERAFAAATEDEDDLARRLEDALAPGRNVEDEDRREKIGTLLAVLTRLREA